MKPATPIENLAALYHYFDELVGHDVDADILFASSYVRGFISLAACHYGDEQQALTQKLATDVSESLQLARTELTPQDREIVKRYWQALNDFFCA